MQQSNKFSLFLQTIGIYLILLAAHGYIFGYNDQIEVLPYALFLNDNNLYPTDFFVQEISRFIPNERYLFAVLFVPFVKYLPLFCGILHAVCSLSLLLGLFAIGKLLIRNTYLVWGAMLCCFLPLYNINLGGNELYYNMFVSSFAAKAILVWSVYFFLENKYRLAFLLLIPATLLHPVAGAQVFLLLSGVAVLGYFFKWLTIDFKKNIPVVLLFLGTAGAWIFYLNMNLGKAAIDNKLFFEIIEFRISHHYMPTYFPLKHFLFLGSLFLFGIYFFYKNHKKIFLFFLLAIIGMSIYTFAVELLENPTILSSQWFKSSIWLEMFSVFALFAFAENRLAFLREPFLQKAGNLGILVLILVAIFILANPIGIFKKRPYDFCWKTTVTPEIQIAQQAKKLTDENAVFLVPPDNTTFKYYSQRSSYVEYKTVVHRKDALAKWYDRIRQIYDVNIEDKRAGKDITRLALSNYFALTKKELQAFKQMGVDYIFTEKRHQLDLSILYQYDIFVVYRLE